MLPQRLYNHAGQQIALLKKLAEGGEGFIFEVSEFASLVAKVYKKPVSTPKADKLKAMVGLASAEIIKFSAWPQSTLHASPNGAVVGILMPKIADHKELHTLFSPQQRKVTFPRADWAFLIRTAANCAAAFETVHRAGHIIGDVNQKNVLVSSKATVYLIDCDSFQVRRNGRLFPCEVGVPDYVPPELRGPGALARIERTPNHDRFGLAILIFQLLLLGRHPFTGKFLGRGEMPMEQAIREYRFAYGRAAQQYQMTPPPYSPSLSALSPELSILFERAFDRSSAQASARPSAAEWGQCLVNFERQLKRCSVDPGHRVPLHLSTCPWCELMRIGAPNYFISVAASTVEVGKGIVFVLEAIWRQIEQVPAPRVGYQRPGLPAGTKVTPSRLPLSIPSRPPRYIPTALPEKVRIPRSFMEKLFGWVAVGSFSLWIIGCCIAWMPLIAFSVITVIIFAIWCIILEGLRLSSERLENADWERTWTSIQYEQNKYREDCEIWEMATREEKSRRQKAWQTKRAALDHAESFWQQEANKYRSSFLALKASFDIFKRQYEGLSEEHKSEFRQLQQDVQNAQLQQFLTSKFLNDASIPGIGTGRVATLLSYSIETAFDVEESRINKVPGFGPVLTKNLLEWRSKVERGFRFDARAGIPKPMINSLEAKYKQKKRELEMHLSKGPQSLRIQTQQAENHLLQILSGIQELVVDAAQAQADLSVLAA